MNALILIAQNCLFRNSEQRISGPFKITSIKNILPQKKPADEDTSDDYDYRPVTAIFTHVSDQVYNIDFDNGENLGVTFQHPIYSVTAGDWQLEGELEICLLYTSPSPRDGLLSRMPSSA